MLKINRGTAERETEKQQVLYEVEEKIRMREKKQREIGRQKDKQKQINSE